MSHTVILGPREHHAVRTLHDEHVPGFADRSYSGAHDLAIAKMKQHGMRVDVHESDAPIAARINDGSWLVDCGCRNAPLTSPAWGVAYCFGCGVRHTNVVFPDEHGAIASVLLERPRMENRNWFPGESVEDLRAQNRAHGVEE